LTGLCSDRLIEILIANPSKLHFGQEVPHCDIPALDYYLGDIQTPLDYYLGDIQTPYPNIEEDMEFTKVLIVK
jgi:hypothetical protein